MSEKNSSAVAGSAQSMNSPLSLQGNILTPQGWVSGTIQFDQRVTAINGNAVDPDAGDAKQDHYILPGFIDLHVHGAGGKDTMEAGDATQVIARAHARHGTT